MSKKTVCIIALIVVISIIIIFVMKLDIFNWQKLDVSKIYNIELSTKVYDENGEEAAVLSGSMSRTYVPIEELPPHVYQAFIAAEDTRFYNHNGIDIRRIAGALLANIKSGEYSQGASTITQQLIKLTHLNSEKTLSRKAQEAYLALQLEKELTKNEILEAYINVVYFGGGAYGIEAAAQRYFSKGASELTVSEAALLAGIIKSPTNYAPHNDMNAALRRRNYVLDSMYAEGFIDRSQMEDAQNSQVVLNEMSGLGDYSWFIDLAAMEAMEILEIDYEELLSGGYAIYTSLNSGMQNAAENIMYNAATYPEAAAQGAMIVIDPHAGAIKAVVGGREYAARFGMNRAMSAYRQPGSIIKPISTYAAAIEEYGYLPSTTVYDVQREYAGGYAPGNAGNSYYGATTMRRALSKSLNAATVDLADTIGIKEVAGYAEEFGLEIHEEDKNLALALGSMTHGVTPVQICAAYAALANGGQLYEPYCVEKIIDRTGKVIYEADKKSTRILSEDSTYILTDMLVTAAQEGTAASLGELGIAVASKTGTAGLSNGDTSDAWAVAYTPDIVVTAWIGKDSNADGGMAKGVSGSGYAVPACKSFLAACRDDVGSHDFLLPEELSRVLVDEFVLMNENRLALASGNTPGKYVCTEILRDTDGLEVSKVWDVPESITDIRLVSQSGEIPVIQFTGTNKYAYYMIVRKTKRDSETIGLVECQLGQTVQFKDTGADVGQVNIYSIIPVHSLLYEEGITITGTESASVQANPAGILNGISSFFENNTAEHEIETIEDPLF